VPKDWADDRGRRAAAGIPGDLKFATKPALAAEIVKQLLAEGRCPPWVTGDEVYGRDAKLDPGLIPLTVTEIKRVFNLVTRAWQTIRHYLHWSWWRRRHQARARWFHHRARLRRLEGSCDSQR
jgi:hypothetical protein